MGRFILESTKMKVLIAGLLCATVAMALPEGRRLRAEEHWRPAQGRDLSKYKPRQATVPATAENLAWAIKEVKKNGASTKKGTNVDLKATCGIEGPARAGRIVGGHEAEEHEWPWQVALFIDDAWFCGGSLINENYVLTAAHCVDGASYFDIMAGAHNVRAASEPNRVEITSYNGWTHPQWDTNTLANDLALIELPSAIDFNDYIAPSCLPMAGDTADEAELVTVTGWGSHQTVLEESPQSSGWSQISPASLTRSATTSMELSETESSALTLPEERDPATEILVAPWS